jgi:hypothetical protein
LIAPVDVMRQYYEDEERFLHLGVSAAGRVLALVVTWRDDLPRVITAYGAPANFRERYWLERNETYGTGSDYESTAL